ncbi:MAG: hypothetical protein ABF391_01515 [Akkermansiaceae bacterium]
MAFLVASCTTKEDIWNASDLEVWVRDQAVEKGYRKESIQLEDWYRKEGEQLFWHGEGVEASSGKKSSFSIRVDKVWTPSGSN